MRKPALILLGCLLAAAVAVEAEGVDAVGVDTAGANAAGANAAGVNAAAAEAVPDDAVLPEAVAAEAVSDDAVSDDAVSDDSVQAEGIAADAVPGDAVQGETGQEEAVHSADASARSPESGRLYAQVRQSVVDVLVNGRLEGSGFFVDAEGLVLTAAHVIGGPNRRVQVLTAPVERLPAEVVAVDLGHDLALLRVVADKKSDAQPAKASSARSFPALPLADKLPEPGEEVYLLGTPLFRRGVMVRGMMAQPGTTFEFYLERYAEVCHIAATVPAGMSGGPWLNRRGQVVGVQSAVMSKNSIPLGVADMIPLPALRDLLKRRCNAATATLGVGVEEPWQQDGSFWERFPPDTDGLVVRVLRKDGPAARAGLQLWDMITAVDGQPVCTIDQMVRLVRSRKPGQTVRLDVLGPDGTGRRRHDARLGKLEVGWPESKTDE